VKGTNRVLDVAATGTSLLSELIPDSFAPTPLPCSRGSCFFLSPDARFGKSRALLHGGVPIVEVSSCDKVLLKLLIQPASSLHSDNKRTARVRANGARDTATGLFWDDQWSWEYKYAYLHSIWSSTTRNIGIPIASISVRTLYSHCRPSRLALPPNTPLFTHNCYCLTAPLRKATATMADTKAPDVTANEELSANNAPEFEHVQWTQDPALRRLYILCCFGLMVASATTGYDG
jgi:hypothetical protein